MVETYIFRLFYDFHGPGDGFEWSSIQGISELQEKLEIETGTDDCLKIHKPYGDEWWLMVNGLIIYLYIWVNLKYLYIWVNEITTEPCSPEAWKSMGIGFGKSSPFMAQLISG